eukprot:TRINITY_DN526_c0_g1_i4.p1 TRINITY_DN526_c0_g1~~TRINITY_DN526_c0_g1_i4.p1  ORF type:complete len:417 (-),score=101.89 TRINITY_DN526_c0_g1_i4:853-2103(-)
MMAWQTHASNNADMVTQLRELGVIKSDKVASAFRAVDRGAFLPPALSGEAYFDQPLRHMSFHQSAVHIYAMCLESLELDKGMSFLNIGSGTGYLSTMAAYLCGQWSVHHGLELDNTLVDFSTKNHNSCLDRWPDTSPAGKATADSDSDSPDANSTQLNSDVAPFDGCSGALRGGAKQGEEAGDAPFARVKFFHGNVYELDVKSCMRYDRVYIGAACPPGRAKELMRLLSKGGVLMAPVGDEFIKVTRTSTADSPDSFREERMSGVRFAPLMRYPAARCALPRVGWTREAHHTYSPEFKESVKALLLSCSSTAATEGKGARRKGLQLAVSSPTLSLPPGLLTEILHFTDREWFVPPPPAEQLQAAAAKTPPPESPVTPPQQPWGGAAEGGLVLSPLEMGIHLFRGPGLGLAARALAP